MITKTCKQCKKQFKVYPCRKDTANYCSKECANKGRQERVMVTCQGCGKKFEVVKSREDAAKYCSQKCQTENYELSEEGRQKIREANKGKNGPHWKGGKVKRECEYCGEEFEVWPCKVKNREGKYCSRSCSAKDRLAGWNKGLERWWDSPSEFKEGHEPWNAGETKETSRMVRKMAKNRMGEKNPAWNGGISFKPYPIKFNEELKEKIRKRDNYVCARCGENGKTIHHIDYNKQNCDEDNLIVLCKSCNSKVNFDREYWEQYFKGLKSIHTTLICKRKTLWIQKLGLKLPREQESPVELFLPLTS